MEPLPEGRGDPPPMSTPIRASCSPQWSLSPKGEETWRRVDIDAWLLSPQWSLSPKGKETQNSEAGRHQGLGPQWSLSPKGEETRESHHHAGSA